MLGATRLKDAVAGGIEARYNSCEIAFEASIDLMPTYVYGCDTCGHRFEKVQRFQDAPLSECPECGARIRRIFQPAGIVFKGSGWYSTDSRSTRQTATDSAVEAGGGGEGGKANGEQATSTAKPEAGASKTSTKTESTAAPKAAE